MLDVIKEYLVSLGYDVDMPSFNKAKSIMNQTDRFVGEFTNSSARNFALAGSAVAGFVATASVGLAKYMQGLAKADIESQKFARLMWTSQQQAMSYKNTMEAMGVTMQDLLLSPELMQQFQSLRREANSMMPPLEEYKQQMQVIRSIVFEFQRLKLISTYALQWVGYYLYQYLEEPIKSIKGNFSSFSDMIQKSMPKWTEKIAQVLSWIIRLSITATKAREAIILIGTAFTAFKFVNIGPLGLMIAGLTALLLLLDDYYTYQNGGESALPELWKWVEELKDSMDDAGIINEFKENISGIADELLEMSKNIGNVLDKLAELANYKDFGKLIEDGIIKYFRALAEILGIVEGLLKSINKLMQGDFKGYDESAKEVVRDKIFDKIFDIFGNLKDAFDKVYGGDDDKPKPSAPAPYPSSSNMPTPFSPYSPVGFSMPNKNQMSSYLYPKLAPVSTAPVNVDSNINIYGSEPYATAKAVKREMTSFYMRYLQGVVR